VQIFVVDAFTSQPFGGNPAGVCFLDGERPDAWMLAVAAEMKHAETAFLLSYADGSYGLRWWTPEAEVPLCGHATLASAHALWETGYLDRASPARFHTLSGELQATRAADGRITLDFPVAIAEPVAEPLGLFDGLGIASRPLLGTPFFTLVELPEAAAVRDVQPDAATLRDVETDAVIVTATSDDPRFDVVCRVFGPRIGIPEDAATGAAMCVLAPFWEARFGQELRVVQLSARGGELHVLRAGERVFITGSAVTVVRGELVP